MMSPPVSEEQLATATDGYYMRESQFSSPVGSQRPQMLGRCSFRGGSVLFFSRAYGVEKEKRWGIELKGRETEWI